MKFNCLKNRFFRHELVCSSLFKLRSKVLKIEFASKEKKRFQVFDRLIKKPSNVKRRGNGKSDVLWSLVKGRFPLSKYFYYFSRAASLNLSDFHRCRRSRKKDTEIFLPVSKPKRWTDFRYPDRKFSIFYDYVSSRTATWFDTIHHRSQSKINA